MTQKQAAEVEAIRARHRKSEWPEGCCICGDVWPCDAATLLHLLDRAGEEIKKESILHQSAKTLMQRAAQRAEQAEAEVARLRKIIDTGECPRCDYPYRAKFMTQENL